MQNKIHLPMIPKWKPAGIWDGSSEHERIFACVESQKEFYDFVQRRKGYVYAVTNSDLDGWIKIGRTSKNPFERAFKLKTAGTHGSFDVIWTAFYLNSSWAEAEIHRKLHGYHSDREWFYINIDVVKPIMDSVLTLESQVTSTLNPSGLLKSFEEWDEGLNEAFALYSRGF